MKKILCVGIAVYDRIFKIDQLPQNEGKFFASALVEQGGGPAATAAVAAARLGVGVDLIARGGDDATGRAIVDELAAEKVGVDKMRIIKGAVSTQASILVDHNGSRVIVSYPSPSLDDDASFIDEIDFSEYSIVLADVRWPSGALRAFTRARQFGIPTVLDADTTPQPIDDLAALADHAVFSEPGLRRFTQSDKIETALNIAATKTANHVYFTLGSDGYCFKSQSTIIHEPCFKVEVADTTGAGDVFHGAFCAALSFGMSAAEGLRFAAAVSALKCTRPGGRAGIPCRDEVEAFLNHYKNNAE